MFSGLPSLKKKIYLGIVDLQYCVNFCCIADIQLYICIHFFHILFHYGLSQDIEYCSLYFTVGPCSYAF